MNLSFSDWIYGALGGLIGLLLVVCLFLFSSRDAALERVAQLEQSAVIMEQEITRLEFMARVTDISLQVWKNEYEAIAEQQGQKHLDTREAARKDPLLRDFLDIPLHPALCPGNGLLGQNNGTSPAGSACSDSFDAGNPGP